MYQNISEEMRYYNTSDGAKRIVVPGDVFESDIEQKSEWFKLVDESSFKTVEPDEEKEIKHKRR
jgi:hypothetical protein